MQNGSTVVLPPKAAARVPLSKSSAMTMPGPLGCDKWTWLSMPPGRTSRPLASMICPASPRSCPSAAIRPPDIPTSAAKVSDAVATVPPRMMVSNVMSHSRPSGSSPQCSAAASQQRSASVGGTFAADRKGGGLQLGHAELVEQFVIGAVGADRRQRIRHRLRQQLIAEGEGDVGAGDVPDPDFCNAALLERVGGFVDVECRLKLSGAHGGRGSGDGREGAELDLFKASRHHRGVELAGLALGIGRRLDADDPAGEIFELFQLH